MIDIKKLSIALSEEQPLKWPQATKLEALLKTLGHELAVDRNDRCLAIDLAHEDVRPHQGAEGEGVQVGSGLRPSARAGVSAPRLAVDRKPRLASGAWRDGR